MCIQNLVSYGLFVLKILKKKSILTSNKDHNSVANLWRKTINNINVDFVYDNLNTKLVPISLSVLRILKKLISNANQGPLLCCKFAKTDNLLSQT